MYQVDGRDCYSVVAMLPSPADRTRVCYSPDIVCMRSECICGGIRSDEDIIFRCTGYGFPTLCRYGVHVSLSCPAAVYVCRNKCIRPIPTMS